MKRYVSIWFRNLLTDRIVLRQPELAGKPFILAGKERGRMMVKASSPQAHRLGIESGMVLADARAVQPDIEVLEFDDMMAEKLLKSLAKWAIRYSPLVAIDMPDGLIIDATGCSHLWGSESAYLKDVAIRLKSSGYQIRVSMADTIGTAWAVCRYSAAFPVIVPGEQLKALLPLPPHAMRLEEQVLERMYKLGLTQIKSFIHIPTSALRRRFGENTVNQIRKALGHAAEEFVPIHPVSPYQERISSPEPIQNAGGIEIALKTVLEKLCIRLVKEEKGVRQTVFECYRIDGETRQIEIGTSAPSCSAAHLFGLFQQKLADIEPGLGIELFVLTAGVTEPLSNQQEALWDLTGGNKMVMIAELLDRLTARAGADVIHRYLPAEHHWPERSVYEAKALSDKPTTNWRSEQMWPTQLLPVPERIQVSAPVPDYPPMLFRYKGSVHQIKRADGPDRTEQEWWLQDGLHRDYFIVEDEQGRRYWIFRLGHYDEEQSPEWFIHGFFA